MSRCDPQNRGLEPGGESPDPGSGSIGVRTRGRGIEDQSYILRREYSHLLEKPDVDVAPAQSWYWLERRPTARRLRTGQIPGSTLGPSGTGGPNFATGTEPRGLKHGVELGKRAFNIYIFLIGFEHQIALYEELSIFTLPAPRRKRFQQFELFSPLNSTSPLIYFVLVPSYFFSELLYLYMCLLFIDVIDFSKFFKLIEILV